MILRLTGIALLVLWSTWSALAVLLGGTGPNPIRVGLLVFLATTIVIATLRAGPRGTVLATIAVCMVVLTAYLLGIRPRNDRSWAADQARLPGIQREGQQVTITNFRSFRYRSPDDWDEHWTTQAFDLDQLVGADLGVERLSSIEAVAHTFVSFRFETGPILVASVEIRKEKGESFSALKGLFRQYEKMIVLGDERDLVELRAVHRHDTVYLHPLTIGPEKVRAFLTSVLDEAAAIHDQPVFYNTFSASCSSSLATHIRAVEPIALDPRMFLPGYADSLALELGWLAGSGTLEERRAAHRIDQAARSAQGQPDFSDRIRVR